MTGWRIWRASHHTAGHNEEVPYSCGFASTNGKELFLVATVHISPKAARDVEAVIRSTNPNITMIELDEERLDRMRDVEPQQPRDPPASDLQPILITESGHEPLTLRAQRALWNGERSGETLSAAVVFDEANAYGLVESDAVRGKVALVRRGCPNGGFAPFVLKAHNAARRGAVAVLVVSQQNRLPMQRLGSGSLEGDLRAALRTWSCGYPRIPLLLLTNDDGERVIERCCHIGVRSTEAAEEGCGGAGARAEFTIMADSYPRRTLRRRLCQACALVFSGIGILYGVIQCFAVEVGAEFTTAESVASEKGIPCVCIDVDMNSFWGRLGHALLPTPCNLGSAALAWLAFPRILARALFPRPGDVDVLGSTVLHAASFPARTWIAFIVAGGIASLVMAKVLQAFSFLGEQGVEKTGAISQRDRTAVQGWIMFLFELFVYPQVYQAVADSRDETMYQSIVAKGREHRARRLVVVVGAAHSNGILQRARVRGL